MPSYWCEFAWLGGPGVEASVRIDTAAGRITAISVGAPFADDTVRLSGVTLPGLANAHSHAFHRALRGRTHHGGGTFWTWRDQMYELASTLDPESYQQLAEAVFAEMVLAGVTCVGEFHYLHHGHGGVPYSDPNAMSTAVMTAAERAGLRITLLDTLYLHGGIDQAPNEVQQRFSDGDVDTWAERVERLNLPAHARLGAAIHSVRAVDPPSMSVAAGWARSRGAVLHAHVSEQPAENDQCVGRFGLTPVQLLARSGALSERFTAVHATHLTAADVHELGSTSSVVCMCPTTERDLADGIGPAAALRAAGAGICVGSDSHAVIDLFEEARAIELDERLATLERGRHRSEALLSAATFEGHQALGWTDAGVLEPGARADLVTVRLDSVRLAGTPAARLVDSVVYAAAASDVSHVVIDGKVVVSDGRHVTIDVPDSLSRVLERVWSAS